MSAKRKPLVIYHSNCMDGTAAAWCFWKRFKDDMEYAPGVYSGLLPDVYDRTVYMVDFSYKRDVMEDIIKFSGDVILLDHHKSALEDLEPLRGKEGFDMSASTLKNSGAMIAWDYVKRLCCHDEPTPLVLQYIEDRDLWLHKMPSCKPIMAAVMSYPRSFEAFDELMGFERKDLLVLLAEGNAILRAFELNLESNLRQCVRTMTIGGFQVPTANMNGQYASDGGNRICLANDVAFAATYYDTEEYRCFSLRSLPTGADVSAIAAQYGGGGHKNAAGFKVPRDHELARA